jgi:uncharacterized membrane protein
MDAAASPEPVHHASAQHKLFWVAVTLKGLNGVLELVGGTALAMIPAGGILAWVDYLTHSWLANDPDNLIANWLMHWAARFEHSSQIFAAVYLVAHGVTKVVLSTLLLMGRKIAYPIAIVLFTGLDLFVLRHLFHHFSWPVTIFLAIDVVIIVIIARDWIAEGKGAAA